MKFCNYITYNLDLFKSPLYLFFNSQKKVSSKFSIFISICVIIFLVAFIIQSDLLNKKNPITSIQSIQTNDRPLINFDEENMSLAFGITDAANKFYKDDTIFKFYLKNYFFKSDGDLIKLETKKINNCEASYFKNYNNVFTDLGLKGAFCSETRNFTLEGYWDEKFTNYVEILLVSCENSTLNNNTCKSAEYIHNFFKDKYISVFFSNNIVNVTNYENPIQKTFKTKFFALDKSLAKTITMNFKKVNLKNDDGLIFESESYLEAFMLDENIYTDLVVGERAWLSSVVLYPAPEIYTITRKYQKIQEAIANVGGLAHSLILIGYFLTFLEKEFIVFKIIMNSLYSFTNHSNLDEIKKFRKEPIISNFGKPHEEIKKSITDISNKGKKESEIKFNEKCNMEYLYPKILPTETNSFEFENCNKNINNDPPKKVNTLTKLFNSAKIKEFFKIINRKNVENQFSIKFLEFLKVKFHFPFIKLTQKEKIYLEAFKMYKKEIDVVNIIQKLQNIDKLKIILLTDDQSKFFNLIEKPFIYLNKNEVCKRESQVSSNVRLTMKINNSKEGLNIANFQNYYSKVKKEGENANEVDKRLIKLIDLNLNLTNN